MKSVLIVLFSLGCNILLAQENLVVGQVVNSVTSNPLPYVNIVLEDQHRGTSTDFLGRFSFKLKGVDTSASLKFSFVGFKTKRLKIKALKNRVVKMQPDINTLAEVQLYHITENKSEIINDFRGKESIGLGNFSGGQFPSIVARYYARPVDFKEGYFLEEVEVRFFSTTIVPDRSSKFRLRILGVGENGKPAGDLLRSNLIIERGNNSFKTKISLLKYRISIPEEGFFVAVEHLFIKENEYLEENDYRLFKKTDTLLYKDVRQVKYLPVFKGVLVDESSNFISYFKDTEAWKKITDLDNSNPVFKGEIPSPAFKITLTD
ncbi:carboxypeptidase-like protein [Salegentibacter sp. 24]|uniref:carboxypeptidase-like regulatory domain-containing protein n=1 Tax=Salegentibacter sp. 24 TaxID=2183986 RepID=UPI00105DAC49|nr:carboxypeptidase-like regulatory domain-containing protein [Salegentibacter sp. 24]TDN88788.1 carboxypeptidase-like protein [Salegentibacter sp. 24]